MTDSGCVFSEEETEREQILGRGKVVGGMRSGGKETLIGMYCIREESIFNLKKKKVNTQLLSGVLPAHSIINLLPRLLFYERPQKFL